MLPQRLKSRKVGLDRRCLRFARQPFAYDDHAPGAIHDVPNVTRAEKLSLSFCSSAPSQHEQFFVGEKNAHLKHGRARARAASAQDSQLTNPNDLECHPLRMFQTKARVCHQPYAAT
jgi:hypothetical protein